MIGQILNHRYEILEKLGEGGMAIAYRGRDRVLGRTVAIKVMRPELSGDAEFLARFRREARAAAGVTHPHIAGIYDTGNDGPHHYIVMEYVDGESLRDRLRREGPLPLAEALRIATETAEALGAAHAAEVVHRDIKPHNILLSREGQVKVTDFGIARATASSGQTETGKIIGSMDYVSPEQARGDAVGPQSDLYSLGVTLFEMLAGRTPFEGLDRIAVLHKHIYDQPPPITDFRPGLPAEVESLVEHCLEKDLSLRFASARELIGYLGACPRAETARRGRLGGGLAQRLGHGVNQASWWVRRRWAWAMVLALLAVAGGGSSAWLALRPRPLPKVPDLVGMSAAAARTAAELRGYEYRLLGERASEDVAAGVVLSQDPPAGSARDLGTVVKVVVSKGSEQVVVPNVTEMILSAAQRNLRAVGLVPATPREVYDDRIPAGYVATTYPGPGAKVVVGTTVGIDVSLGPKPTNVPLPPGPTPPTAGGARQSKEESFTYMVPAEGDSKQKVKVTVQLIDDEGNKRILYEGLHLPGELIPQQTFTVTDPVVLRVLVDGEVKLERPFSASEP
jgi:hypothetical protein